VETRRDETRAGDAVDERARGEMDGAFELVR